MVSLLKILWDGWESKVESQKGTHILFQDYYIGNSQLNFQIKWTLVSVLKSHNLQKSKAIRNYLDIRVNAYRLLCWEKQSTLRIN